MKTKAKENYKPTLPYLDCAALYVKSQRKLDNGSNSCLSDFMALMLNFMNAKADFTIDDVIVAAKAKELPTEEVKDLFQSFTLRMLDLGKLRGTPPLVYDNWIFSVV